MPIIVTAYYRLPNKYDSAGNIYIKWMKNFIPYVENMIIIFVENKKDFLGIMNEEKILLRKNIHIIEKKMTDFLVHKYNWDSHYNIDPEKKIHNVNLYKIWNEKINFLKIVSDLYPLIDDYYVWTDIGVIRDSKLRPFLRYYPDKKLVNDKMHFLRMSRLNNIYDGNIIDISNILSHIGGGIIAGHRDIIHQYHEKYYNMLDEFFEKNIFAGKDQNIMYNMTLRYPDMIQLIDHTTNNWMHKFQSNRWFYMLNFLIEKKQFIVCNPVRAGLCNLFFHICSSYGYAVQTNRVFFLTDTAISAHTKIDYTNTLFNYFQKIDNGIINDIENLREKKYETFIGLDTKPEKNFSLSSYLQNEKYFNSVRDNIIQIFNSMYDISNSDTYDYFVHCRRGDYVNNSFHYVNLDKYFDSSIDYIKKVDPEWKAKRFCILSDDINWCKNTNFLKDHDINITYIENKNELDTLKIMVSTRCGGIGSNSTYSWWGLWLNKNNDSISILPSKWTAAGESHIYFDKCIKIDV
jgi:hypothetical protein